MSRLHALFALLVVVIAAMVGLKHFSTGDRPLKELQKGGVILAFGDSLTYGTGAGPGESYPEKLEKRLGRRVINAGIPGELSEQGLKRLESLLDLHHPDLLLLCHGGNDILRKSEEAPLRSNLEAMVRMAKNRGSGVILIAVPRFGLLHLSPHPLYEEIAEANAIPLENDILSELLSDNRTKSDYIHPNALGYEKMAEAVEKVVREHYALEE